MSNEVKAALLVLCGISGVAAAIFVLAMWPSWFFAGLLCLVPMCCLYGVYVIILDHLEQKDADKEAREVFAADWARRNEEATKRNNEVVVPLGEE